MAFPWYYCLMAQGNNHPVTIWNPQIYKEERKGKEGSLQTATC